MNKSPQQRVPYNNRQLLNADNRTLQRISKLGAKDAFTCCKCKNVVKFSQLLKVKGFTFHDRCFRCDDCDTSLDPTNCRKKGEKFFCFSCRPTLLGKIKKGAPKNPFRKGDRNTDFFNSNISANVGSPNLRASRNQKDMKKLTELREWKEMAPSKRHEETYEYIYRIKVDYPRNLFGQVFDPRAFVGDNKTLINTFLMCVLSGIQNPNSLIGCYVKRSQDYERLHFFFDPLLRRLAKLPVYAQIKACNMELHKQFPFSEDYDISQIGEENAFEQVEMEFRRNIATFSLPGHMSKEERKHLECYVKELVELLPERYSGTFYSFDKQQAGYISESGIKTLHKASNLDIFTDISKDRFLLATGIVNDYPLGRGVFVSADRQYVLQYGLEDHLVIKVCSKDKNLSRVYSNLLSFYNALNASADKLKIEGTNSKKKSSEEYEFIKKGVISGKTLQRKRRPVFNYDLYQDVAAGFRQKHYLDTVSVEEGERIPSIKRRKNRKGLTRATSSSTEMHRFASFSSQRTSAPAQKYKVKRTAGRSLRRSFESLWKTGSRKEVAGINFEVHEKYGYITSCPSNLGAGFKVKVYVNLPNLSEEGLIKQKVNALGLGHQGIHGEYSLIGEDGLVVLYPLSNVNRSEEDIVAFMHKTLAQVCEEEKKASYV
eukprot:snap_masked-scaffold_7-processed-gene-4.20-mRNA-1 protein AED:1.00 eAED:1.00 QI:0/-1/0/0/-1/1/1/0/656